MTGKRVMVVLGVGSALIPLLLFAYMARYNRFLVDDYGYLGLARDIGAWKAMAIWRETWNGGYTNFLLYGLLVPFGASAPTLSALVSGATAFAGFGWLINTLLAVLAIQAHRRAMVVGLAALATAATIHGLYHAQAFYWMTATVVYSLPVAILLVGMALAVAMGRRLRGRLQHFLAAIGAALFAFVNAGFSEMYLVFQLSASALITVFLLLFQHGARRGAYVTLASAALLGTLASLPVQATSAGVAFRSSRTSVFDKFLVGPVRDLPNLIDRTLHEALIFAGREASFAGFMLVASAGFFLALSAYAPAARDSKARTLSEAKAPVAFALVAQLLFVPILWSHQSDSLQVLGRFSYAYALVIGVNLLGILSLLMLLWQRERFEVLVNRRNGLMTWRAAVLLAVCLVFALTQVRDSHYKASSYLFVTAVSLLLMLGGQLTYQAEEPRLQALFRLSAFATAVAAITLGALHAAALWGMGLIVGRAFTAVAYTLMLAGLLIGLLLGASIRRGFDATASEAIWLRAMRLGSLLVALTIAAGIVIGQGQRIGYARRDAEIWDATHREIIRLRDQGDPAVYTRRFPRVSLDEYASSRSSSESVQLGWRKMLYYQLLEEGGARHDCNCSSEKMALGEEASKCARVMCLAYGASE